MRIREGDPLEIYTSKDGEVIFKKYSLMGGVDEFAAQLCDTLSKSTGTSVAVTDRDSVIAAAGSARRDLIGKRISPQLEQIMEDRGIYRAVPSERSVFVTESLDRYCATIAAPIISEGDALGLVVFIGTEGESAAGETEYKLAQAIAGFLGKHMESWKKEDGFGRPLFLYYIVSFTFRPARGRASSRSGHGCSCPAGKRRLLSPLSTPALTAQSIASSA